MSFKVGELYLIRINDHSLRLSTQITLQNGLLQCIVVDEHTPLSASFNSLNLNPQSLSIAQGQ